MKWNRLKNSECPSCGRLLKQDGGTKMIVCSGCTFKISEERLNEIIRFGFQPKPNSIFEEEQKLAELNNLGHKPFNPYEL